MRVRDVMVPGVFLRRAHGFVQRNAARRLFSRSFAVDTPVALVSFTFDDFPRSALTVGGPIMKRFDIKATYYAAFGLMGTTGPSGRIFDVDDLQRLLEQGHEIGCHTFDHYDAWNTSRSAFERSIVRNAEALEMLAPNVRFRTFSYPMSPPRPLNKRSAARHFACSRGGGQTFNAQKADRDYLHAFFLEQARNNLDLVKDVVDRNLKARGWLILATHDVDDRPTPYGCTPDFFERVVQHVVKSGSRILPVADAMDALQRSRSAWQQ
jgi:peptidoglycan/xylan/chitin deacetylase (PgdA/CDA1 family)